MRKRLVAAAAAALLGGCQELDPLILREGQRTSINATHDCNGLMKNRRDTIRDNTAVILRSSTANAPDSQ